MIIVHRKRCPQCGTTILVSAPQVVEVSGAPIVNCPACGHGVQLSLVVSIVCNLTSLVGGAYIAMLYMRAAEDLLGAPLSAVPFLALFVVGLAAAVIIHFVLAPALYLAFNGARARS